ncbi:DNRLRE domain-containing protein [Bacteroides salyersiae]|nr:DNRLRE domain-containing protein [Bacteroides salyersiae]
MNFISTKKVTVKSSLSKVVLILGLGVMSLSGTAYAEGGGTQTKKLIPIADGFVRGKDYMDIVQSNQSISMHVMNGGGEGDNSDRMAYMKFDISDIIDLPSDAVITKAQLRLYIHDAQEAASEVNLVLSDVPDNNWEEATLCYSNRPYEGDYIAECPGEYMKWNGNDNFDETRCLYLDMTDYMKKQRTAGRTIISLHLYQDIVSATWKNLMEISTREAVTKNEERCPTLTVEYSSNATGIRNTDVGQTGKVVAVPSLAGVGESITLQAAFPEDLAGDLTVEAYDVVGKCVKSVELVDGEATVAFAQSGMYILRVNADGKQMNSTKIIVR